MNTIVIDTTQHESVGPREFVGGLTLFERTTRMAARIGAQRAIILGDRSLLPHIATPRLEIQYDGLDPDHDFPVMRSDVLYVVEDDELQPLITISDDATRAEAEDKLWDGCRKSVDGIISRYINRNISLFISRRIAHTSIRPNHVTAVTFGLGLLAGALAAIGGTFAWVLAGFFFQATSVLDGVDGELARVRMDGSVLGEWLDTISDDSSDVLMYAGLGFGAYRVLYATPLVPAGVWLALGLAAAAGKLASMVVYYRWLRANGRGDLLAFQWSFDDDSAPTALSRLLSNLRYVTKNDFIAFTVMMLGFFGILPWFLFVAVIGTWTVAIAALRESR